ncbi:MAG: hypothetical protein QM757_41250 [Paludibaculum sp.]
MSETITVSDAAATKVETDTSTLNQTLARRRSSTCPSQAGFVSLAGLTAGVVPVTGENGQSLQTSFTNRGNLSAFVSGQRESSVSFLIDGVESRGERLGNASMPVSVDAIQQFGMLRNTISTIRRRHGRHERVHQVGHEPDSRHSIRVPAELRHECPQLLRHQRQRRR